MEQTSSEQEKSRDERTSIYELLRIFRFFFLLLLNSFVAVEVRLLTTFGKFRLLFDGLASHEIPFRFFLPTGCFALIKSIETHNFHFASFFVWFWLRLKHRDASKDETKVTKNFIIVLYRQMKVSSLSLGTKAKKPVSCGENRVKITFENRAQTETLKTTR